jgi:hypothetical protein
MRTNLSCEYTCGMETPIRHGTSGGTLRRSIATVGCLVCSAILTASPQQPTRPVNPRLTPEQRGAAHSRVVGGSPGEVDRQLAKTTGDLTLDLPPWVDSDHPRYTEADLWGMEGQVCNSALVVAGRVLSSAGFLTADHGYLYTESSAVATDVYRSVVTPPLLPGEQLVVVGPGGTVVLFGRRVHAEDPAKPLLADSATYIWFLRLIKETGAFEAALTLRTDDERITSPSSHKTLTDPHWLVDRATTVGLIKAAALRCRSAVLR